MNGKTMKNKMRKTLLLAVALACCLACPLWQGAGGAWAESPGTVRIEGVESAWRAYRLVAGEVADGRISSCSTEGLMNGDFWKRVGIEGGGQDAAEALAAIASGDSDGAATARLGRAAIACHAPCVEVGKEEARAGFSLESGYWLLVSDLSQPLLVPIGAGEHVLTAKSTGPKVEKQVKDAAGQWKEAAEAAQGSMVDYRIVSTMPSNAAAYERLSYRVVDELPAGMWADAGSVHVAVRDAAGSEVDVTSSCAVSVSGQKLEVDVGKGNALALVPKDAGTASVVVSYRAKLTEGSSAGAKTGNPNLVHIEYPGSPTSDATVSGEKAMAQLYTWKIRLVKSGSGKALAGASFELRSSEGKTVGTAVTGDDGSAEFPSVASGTYRLVETEAPEGYDRAADTMVTISSDLGAKGGKTTLSAHAEGAGTLQSVSVPKGLVTVAVEDEPEGGDGEDRSREGLDEESEGVSGTPKTGDTAGAYPLAAGILLAAGAALATCAYARRRGHEK